jgi:HEAT repeat protein
MEVALMTLANSKRPGAADALLSVAQDPQAGDDIRAMALFNAGSRGNVDVAQLRSIYQNTDSRELKVQVCHLLSQMDGQPGALDLMLEIVRTEPDMEIRQNAVFWIGQFDDPRAVEALLEIIDGK